MSEVIKAYPLQWPADVPRTERSRRKRAKFRSGKNWMTIAKAVDRVIGELRRFGVNSRDDIVISTNVPTNLSGYPRSDAKQPNDVGVAVYFVRRGKAQCIPIDIYDYVEDNIAAVAASLDALRALERHGGAQILERAFTGFAALPPAPNWREQLGFAPEQVVTPQQLKSQYLELAKTKHPDKGGAASDFALLNQAYERAQEEVK